MKRMPAKLGASLLAEYAGCMRNTIYNSVRRGELKPELTDPVFLFTREEAQRWIAWRKKNVRPGPKGGS